MMLKNNITLRSRKGLVTMCDAKKKFETKVSSRVKDNLNKLLVIGSTDFKLFYDIAKDLDEMHKEKVNKLFKKKQEESKLEVYEGVDADIDSEEDDDTTFKR